jgi:hypothetical protein
VEIKPIHITIDVNVRVERALDELRRLGVDGGTRRDAEGGDPGQRERGRGEPLAGRRRADRPPGGGDQGLR